MQPQPSTNTIAEWILGTLALLVTVVSLFLCLNGVEDSTDKNDHAAPKKRKRGLWKK